MKKDLPDNLVEDISIAVVLESETPESKVWNVYLINLKDTNIETVLITSKGYGLNNGEKVKTSTLRHMIEKVAAKSFAKVEAIDEEVFGLNNEYWLSYYIGKEIFDKKFIFLPESILESNFIKVPLVNKPGVMIGD
jgi:transcriptional regulator of heat shock response